MSGNIIQLNEDLIKNKAQSQILWDFSFLTYACLMASNIFRKKYPSSG